MDLELEVRWGPGLIHLVFLVFALSQFWCFMVFGGFDPEIRGEGGGGGGASPGSATAIQHFITTTGWIKREIETMLQIVIFSLATRCESSCFC